MKGRWPTRTGIRKAGDICWINILTPRPAAHVSFSPSCSAGRNTEMPGMGHRVHVGGHDICGLFDLEGLHRAMPAKPRRLMSEVDGMFAGIR